jgi:hypothetical protein
MTTYQVACPQCAYIFRLEVPTAGKYQTECPDCNKWVPLTAQVEVKTPAQVAEELLQAKAERLAVHMAAAK